MAIICLFSPRFYNWTVFDNLVLPDAKMRELHQAYLGAALPEARHTSSRNWDLWGNSGNRRFSPPRLRPIDVPREKVVLSSLETQVRAEGDCLRSTSVLRITNQAAVQNEFVATLDLPDGVLISNYWLHIGNERVPGRLIEKNAALWVYEQIRDVTRRDPGILRYTGPNQVELRVFPLAPYETRITEIEFLHPSSLANIQVSLTCAPNQTTHVLVKAPAIGATLLTANTPAGQTLISSANNPDPGWPQVSQKPVLHFLVEHSAASGSQDPALLTERLREIARSPELNGIESCLVTLANFESVRLNHEPLPLGELGILIQKASSSGLRPRGGFLPDRVLQEEILENKLSLKKGIRSAYSYYPVYVLVSQSGVSYQPHADTLWLLSGEESPVYLVAPDQSACRIHGDAVTPVRQAWIVELRETIFNMCPEPIKASCGNSPRLEPWSCWMRKAIFSLCPLSPYRIPPIWRDWTPSKPRARFRKTPPSWLQAGTSWCGKAKRAGF
ncbi:MAG: hypothetical protein HC904_12425 [Blastochloris sp.]|nr:hypothetical protein [Blastochloris sp.]